MLRRRFYLLTLVLVSLFLFPSVLSAGTIRYGFTYGPNGSNSYTVSPGGVVEGDLLFRLIDDLDGDFTFVFESRPGYMLADPGDGTKFDMSTWIDFPDGQTIHVDGRPEGVQEVLVPYRIRVPEGIPSGDYWAAMGVVLVEDEKREVTGSSFTTSIGLGMKLSVPGERKHEGVFKELEFLQFLTEDDVDTGNDGVGLKFRILYEIIGNVLVRPFVNVRVTNMFGKELYNKEIVLYDTFSNIEKEREFNVEGIKKFIGWANVEMVLSYSLVSVDGKKGVDVFEIGRGNLRVYVIPWLWLSIFLILLFLLLLYVFYRRYMRLKLRSQARQYIVQKGDTLQSVCAKFNVDPEKIIALNKLREPYFLNVDDKILIPNTKEL